MATLPPAFWSARDDTRQDQWHLHAEKSGHRVCAHVRRRACQRAVKTHQRGGHGDDHKRDPQCGVGQHDAQIGALQTDAAVEEVHACGRDNQRYDHRGNQDRHDRPPERHMRLRQADCSQCAQRNRDKCRRRSNLHRVFQSLLPVRVGEEVAVMLERVTLGVKRQHCRGEGEEVLGVETQRDDRENWRDEEKEDRAADELEGVVPKHLAWRGINRRAGAVAAGEQPIRQPRQDEADDHAADDTGWAGDHQACKRKQCGGCEDAGARRRNKACEHPCKSDAADHAEDGAQQRHSVGCTDKETHRGASECHKWQDKADKIDCRLGVFAHCSYPRLTLSMPTIRS